MARVNGKYELLEKVSYHAILSMLQRTGTGCSGISSIPELMSIGLLGRQSSGKFKGEALGKGILNSSFGGEVNFSSSNSESCVVAGVVGDARRGISLNWPGRGGSRRGKVKPSASDSSEISSLCPKLL